MGMGDVIQLITALGLGSVGGGIAGGVSAIWREKHDKAARLENRRRLRANRWRKTLRDPKNMRLPTLSLAVYHEMKPYLGQDIIAVVEETYPYGSVSTITINGREYQDIRATTLLIVRLGELEREWGLI